MTRVNKCEKKQDDVSAKHEVLKDILMGSLDKYVEFLVKKHLKETLTSILS